MPSVFALDQVERPSLVVLPEGVLANDFDKARERYPEAVLVGGVVEGIVPCQNSSRCATDRPCSGIRGVAMLKGRRLVSYRKILTDDRTCGLGSLPSRLPVCHIPSLNLSLGVIVCMDIQADEGGLLRNVIHDLQSQRARHQVLCVAGDMGTDWIPAAQGVHLAVCNRLDGFYRDGGGLKSFIAAADGRKLCEQAGAEAISVDI